MSRRRSIIAITIAIGLAVVGGLRVAPPVRAAPSLPTYVRDIVTPGRAPMYPEDIAVVPGRYIVLDVGRYRVLAISRTSGKVVDRVGGLQGRLPGELGAARALDVDAAGNVYVADTPNNRVQVFDAALDFVRVIGSKGTGDGQFSLPYGIAVGPGKAPGGVTEVVYVADDTGRIQRFLPDGTYIGSFPTRVAKPRQLVVDPETRHVAVVSARDKGVDVFDAGGDLLFSFGGNGSGPGLFNRDPRGIAVDGRGRFYVTDLGNHRIQVFSPRGAFLHAFGRAGSAPSAFTDPRGLAVTPRNVVVVTDLFDHALDEFTTDGTFVKERFGGSVPPNGVNVARGIAPAGGGRFFVVDWWNQRILRIGADGSTERRWGFRGTRQEPGSINFAWDVAVQPGTKRVFVANRESHEVEVFTRDGEYVTRWGHRGHEPGELLFPQGLAFAPDGTLVVADAGNDRIQRFRIGAGGNGTFLEAYGSSGGQTSGPGHFHTPTGISVAADGTIWVTDTANSRIQLRDPSGGWTVLRDLPDATTFRVPWGVSVAPDGSVWVADSGLDRIVVLESSGVFRYAFTGPDVGAGDLRRPFDVAFGPDGRVWISDTWHSRVVELAGGW